MKCTAVVFDLFGTLIDSFTTAEYNQAVYDMAELVAAPAAEFFRLWTDTFDQRAKGHFRSTGECIEHICRELGIRAELEQIKQAEQVRLDLTRRTFVPRAGSLETLSALKSRGYKIGLITDCPIEVPTLWPETPFVSLIDVAVFSCIAGLKKPDPRIYLLACEQLGVTPDECLYVGDGGSRELSGAAAVGMHPVLIRLPDDDRRDPHRVDAEDWSGPRISKIGDVLLLLT